MTVARKIKRNKQKRKEKEYSDMIKEQLESFDKMPKNCTACERPYEKSLESAQTWRVEVHYESATINLICPECFETLEEEGPTS
jgi:hypothetical protein|tara:strand:+ start:286 stop:537 length:252 start_codon:yes stop_codon:yes gene_type:complete